MQNLVKLLKRAKITKSEKEIKSFNLECIRQFSGAWHAMAISLTNQPKELVQDFVVYKFLKAENLYKYPDNSRNDLLKYTLRMLKNHYIDHFKTKERRANLLEQNKGKINVSEARQISETDRVILRMDIEKALNSLSEKSQKMAMGLFLVGYTYKEVAQRMNKSEHAVRNLIYRARLQLKRFFDSDNLKP